MRKHQSDFNQVINGILSGSGIKNIVADVVPGGGKSLLPVIAASKLIPAGLASKIAWICPRMSLQDQGERVFLDPRFRKEFNHNLIIRSSTNQHNPSRGLPGFISTYQALAVDAARTALRDFERHPYILVLDEWHHLAEEGEWTKPIQELYDLAAFRVLLTGTLSRGDKGKIAFVPYQEYVPGEFRPWFREDAETALITYGRKEALAEKAIIPLEFHFADGMAEWKKESGKVIRAKLSTSRSDANQALFTALKTEYAEELLTAGVNHWKCHTHTVNKNGRLMVVAANIETAKEYTEKLRRMGCQAEIATSKDTPGAIRHIKALKTGKLKILVAVAMISEGLDVPSISHIIYLTNVRTAEWIEQTVSRAVRIDPLAGPYETQKGHIFAPADKMFVELARKIEADQMQALAKQKPNGVRAPDRGEGPGSGPLPGITPLSSKLIQPDGQGVLFEGVVNLREVAQKRAYTYEKTQREIETELREEIDQHVKGFARTYGVKIASLNKHFKDYFGKPRDNMTVQELKNLKQYLNDQYEVPQRRGSRTLF